MRAAGGGWLARIGAAALMGVVGCSGAPDSNRPVDQAIGFSGYAWRVKASEGRVGPGPNHFSAEGVRVDGEGRLHLRIFREGDHWSCSEAILKRSLGYGTYVFTLDTPPRQIDTNAVLGLFTWSDRPDYHHRELDIEVSRWGDPANQNAQFAVQPYDRPGNLVRFEIPADLAQTTHVITWAPGRVACRVLKGHTTKPAKPEDVIHEHTFTEGIPVPGDENTRINLWLSGGKPPAAGKDVEVVISRFEFTPPADDAGY